MRARLPVLLTTGAVLLLWALGAAATSPLLLPGPLAVAQAFQETRAELVEASLHTGLASLLGLGIEVVTGMTLALSFQLSRTLEQALYPYALVLQTLPVVAVAPLLVVWLGYGTPVAVASAALVSFFPILTSTHRGLSAASPEQVELLRLYGASRARELGLLRLPAALPYLLTGLRSAGGLAVIGAVVGEFVGSNGMPRSLGFMLIQAIRMARTDLAFAAIACAAALSLACFLGVRALERRLVGRWFGSSPDAERP